MYPSREYYLFFSSGESKGPYVTLVTHNSTLTDNPKPDGVLILHLPPLHQCFVLWVVKAIESSV